jgi:hypothetical protein
MRAGVLFDHVEAVDMFTQVVHQREGLLAVLAGMQLWCRRRFLLFGVVVRDVRGMIDGFVTQKVGLAREGFLAEIALKRTFT